MIGKVIVVSFEGWEEGTEGLDIERLETCTFGREESSTQRLKQINQSKPQHNPFYPKESNE